MANVLLVDDDEDLREAIQSFLEDAGHVVVTARHGADALEVLADRDPPELALVDVYMPVMGGIELIEKMRSEPRLSHIPVIVISAARSVVAPAGTTLLSKIGLRETLLPAIERARRMSSAPVAAEPV